MPGWGDSPELPIIGKRNGQGKSLAVSFEPVLLAPVSATATGLCQFACIVSLVSPTAPKLTTARGILALF